MYSRVSALKATTALVLASAAAISVLPKRPPLFLFWRARPRGAGLNGAGQDAVRARRRRGIASALRPSSGDSQRPGKLRPGLSSKVGPRNGVLGCDWPSALRWVDGRNTFPGRRGEAAYSIMRGAPERVPSSSRWRPRRPRILVAKSYRFARRPVLPRSASWGPLFWRRISARCARLTSMGNGHVGNPANFLNTPYLLPVDSAMWRSYFHH